MASSSSNKPRMRKYKDEGAPPPSGSRSCFAAVYFIRADGQFQFISWLLVSLPLSSADTLTELNALLVTAAASISAPAHIHDGLVQSFWVFFLFLLSFFYILYPHPFTHGQHIIPVSGNQHSFHLFPSICNSSCCIYIRFLFYFFSFKCSFEWFSVYANEQESSCVTRFHFFSFPITYSFEFFVWENFWFAWFNIFRLESCVIASWSHF